jgi:hypothetical protein
VPEVAEGVAPFLQACLAGCAELDVVLGPVQRAAGEVRAAGPVEHQVARSGIPLSVEEKATASVAEPRCHLTPPRHAYPRS